MESRQVQSTFSVGCVSAMARYQEFGERASPTTSTHNHIMHDTQCTTPSTQYLALSTTTAITPTSNAFWTINSICFFSLSFLVERICRMLVGLFLSLNAAVTNQWWTAVCHSCGWRMEIGKGWRFDWFLRNQFHLFDVQQQTEMHAGWYLLLSIDLRIWWDECAGWLLVGSKQRGCIQQIVENRKSEAMLKFKVSSVWHDVAATGISKIRVNNHDPSNTIVYIINHTVLRGTLVTIFIGLLIGPFGVWIEWV